jgi:hypothetical protein
MKAIIISIKWFWPLLAIIILNQYVYNQDFNTDSLNTPVDSTINKDRNTFRYLVIPLCLELGPGTAYWIATVRNYPKESPYGFLFGIPAATLSQNFKDKTGWIYFAIGASALAVLSWRHDNDNVFKTGLATFEIIRAIDIITAVRNYIND